MWTSIGPPCAMVRPKPTPSTRSTSPSWSADLDPNADPPKILVIGPDLAGNLLELVALELADRHLVIHAMPLRTQFHDLLR